MYSVCGLLVGDTSGITVYHCPVTTGEGGFEQNFFFYSIRVVFNQGGSTGGLPYTSILRLSDALQCTRSQARVLCVYFPQLGKMPSGSIPGSTSPPQLPSVTTGESANIESPKGAALVPVAERGGQALPLLRLLVRRCEALGHADAPPPRGEATSPPRGETRSPSRALRASARVAGDLRSPLRGEYWSTRSESERSMLEPPSPKPDSSRMIAGEFCDQRGDDRVPADG